MSIAMMEPTAMPAIAPVESSVGLGDCVAGADVLAVGLGDLVPEVSEAITVNVVAARPLGVDVMVVAGICDEVPSSSDVDADDNSDDLDIDCDEGSAAADEAGCEATSEAVLLVLDADILVCLKPLEDCMEWIFRCCFAG